METYHGISIKPHKIRIILHKIVLEGRLEIFSTIRLSTYTHGKSLMVTNGQNRWSN